MYGLHIEWKRKLMMAGIAVGVFVGYRYLLPAAVPFLAAWVLASWLEPIARRIERRTKIKKGFAGAFLLTGLLLGTGILLYLGIGELLNQIRRALLHLPELADKGLGILDNCCRVLEKNTGILKEDSRAYVLSQIREIQQNVLAFVGKDVVEILLSWARGILFFMSGLVVTFISTLLIMGDMENLRRKIWDYSWLVGTRRVVKRLQKTTVLYLKAQIILIFLVAVVCGAGFYLMGSPYYLILGILLGLFDAVPLIGTGTFLYPSAVIFLIKGKPAIAVGCVLLDILTSVLREALEPRLLGKKLGVSPIAVLASVYLGVLLFGTWGVLLGPLSFSTAYEIGKEWDVWD